MPPPGVIVSGPAVPAVERVLTVEALAFIADLQRRFNQVRLELLHVREDLDEAVLLGNPDVAAQVAAEAVPQRPPGEPAAVLGEVVECHAELAPVDHLERDVVEVGVALPDEGEDVVVGGTW